MFVQKPFHYKIRDKTKNINLQKVISKMQNKKEEINIKNKDLKILVLI